MQKEAAAKSKNFNTNKANNDEWLTPPEIIHALGPFHLDPCAPRFRPWDTACEHYTASGDGGLNAPWVGRVWLNPPYGKETFKWLARLAEHGKGIALIFARTETIGFHSTIWEKADAVFFFKGRLRFHYVTGEQGGAANAPSCLVSYSKEDTISIIKANEEGKLKGHLVFLKELPNDQTSLAH
ncbi:MAG: hypothetical protein BCS36_01210 [Desulfovibrio sp. MES5]|nr:MAG: hypothetical protein BCS36_01210 [Desulfovibrio sp. MES5]